MGSPYIVVERSVGHVRLFHILKYGRIVLSGKIPFCPEAVLEARVGASLPLITLVRHRSRGITCAIVSAGAALSQQAFLRQDIAPVNPFSRFRFRHGSCGSLEESRLPLSRPGSVADVKVDAHDVRARTTLFELI
ncbi:hypothetical protein Bca4012_044062 [Brassica carinata]|uniref:Uncharacterized protein n=1 Tax=Brassica carinata TaxID=52824 RepID=A0A8X7QTU5_BRACI|nr:hypothetical protein Bca52824_058372 [Brassica carinata]